MTEREAARLAASSAVVIVSTAMARSRIVHPAEHDTFRLVNGLPQDIAVPARIVMQAGSLPAVFVVAAVVRRLDRPRLSGATALVGTAVWAGCKVMKRWIGRGRPADHLDDVRQRGASASGLGFPSGHAAVAATLATLLAPEAAPPLRYVLAATAAATAVARVYVGAHLPLDSIGGAAIGVTAGTASQLVSSR
ncbi:MAG: phosphatase PAP2 family protein [Acidimicrobiales bacterium]